MLRLQVKITFYNLYCNIKESVHYDIAGIFQLLRAVLNFHLNVVLNC